MTALLNPVVAILLFACSFLFPDQTVAQGNTKIDSLEKVLTKPSGFSQIQTLNELGWELKYSDPERARKISKQALDLARKLENKKEQALALRNIGAVFFIQGNFRDALPILEEGRNLIEQIDEPFHLAKILNLMAINYRELLMFREALQCQKEALEGFRVLKDSLEIAGNLNNLALLYEKVNASVEALSIYQEVFECESRRNNPEGVARTAINLATLYLTTGEIENARKYFQIGNDCSIKTGNRISEAASYHGLAVTCNVRKEYDKAIGYFDQAIRINRETGNLDYLPKNYLELSVSLAKKGNYLESIRALEIADSLFLTTGQRMLHVDVMNRMAINYRELHDLPQAFRLASQAKIEADTSGYISNQSRLAFTLSTILKDQRDYRKALDYLQEHVSLEDTIAKEDRTSELLKIQTLYDVTKTNQENKALKQEQMIQKQKSLIQRLITIGCVLLLLLLTCFLIYSVSNRKKLQLSNNTKDKFFSIIAHDLNSPFSSLIGLSEHLMGEIDSGKPEEIKKIVKSLYTTSEDAHGLLQNLLQWSQSQRNQLLVTAELLSMDEIVSESIHMVMPNAERKQIRINQKFSPGLTLVTDRNMVQSIFRNLLANAIKFSPAGSEVDFEIIPVSGGLQVMIKDYGVGIPHDKISQLFTLTVKSTRGTMNEGGSGLGLALCKEFTGKLGGTIEVESNPGEGCLVTLYIPQFQVNK